MRLTTRILLVLFSALAVVTAAACYFAVQTAYLEFEQQQQQLGQRLGDQLNRRLAAAYQRDGAAGVARVLREVSPDQRANVEMRWVWLEENGVAGRTKRLSRVRVGEMESVIEEDGRGNRQLRTYIPVDVTANRLGGIELTGSLRAVERETRRLVHVALLTIGGLGVASVAVVYVAGMRWVARPLNALIDKTRRIGQGDFSQPVVLKGSNEFAQLAGAINDMCDQLVRQQEELARQAQERLAALEQLRHADRLKTVGRLAAGLAHELGTPLNVVSGRAALIASGKLDAEAILSSARSIKTEADRITSIVRQLLDFARRRKPQRVIADLRQGVTRTCELLSSLAEKQQIRMVTQMPQESLLAPIDEGQWQQILTNIVLNGIQASPTGSCLTLQLERTTRPHPLRSDHPTVPLARLVVEDEGPGIPEENQELIFEPFYTTKEVGEGTGLGLSIAYGLVREHDGWIDVENCQPHGARFSIFLPLEVA